MIALPSERYFKSMVINRMFKNELLLTLKLLTITPYLVQTSMLPGARR